MSVNIEPEWFTPTRETEKKDPLRFKIRGLDSLEALDVVSHVYVDDGQIFANGRALRSAVQTGIMSWENHKDAQGQPIEFNLMQLTTFDPLTLLEVGKAIIGKTNLTGNEIKN